MTVHLTDEQAPHRPANRYSVLGAAQDADIRDDPFPSVALNDVLSDEIYRQLDATFPSDQTFFSNMAKIKNNQAVRIGAQDVIDNPAMSEDWRAFFTWHTSAGFWKDIVRVFGPSIRSEFPSLEDRFGRPIDQWTVKRRGAPGEADIALDVLFVINTPVTTESSVRPAHVDRKNKIFSGLYYMKQQGDPTPGGDLSLYRFHHGRKGFGGHYARLSDLDEIVTEPYGANKFIGFVNSGRAIHGVTPRPITRWTRRYINFVVETPFDAFKLHPLPLASRLIEGWKRRRTKVPGADLRLPPPD